VITATAPSGTSSLTTPAAGSPQPQATTGAAATVPAGATARPGTTATAVASGTTTTGVYVVVGGDTLSLICSDKIRRPASLTVSDCVDQIKSLNSLTSDNISVGQQLKVPQ
jgi:LysM repeat protein